MEHKDTLRIHNLYTSFKSRNGYLNAISGIDLTVRSGETVGLVGESGCGKSVTAQSIMRLLGPKTKIEGSVYLGDTNLLNLSHRAMRKIRGNEISMIFQEPMTSLNPILRIGDQIAEPLKMHTHLSPSARHDKVIELLTQVGIARPREIANEYPHRLSGGMRQRVMIALAIACGPKVLIADEPTTALDVTVQAQILDLLRVLQEENHMSLLLITHDLGVVAEMCERVAVMYAGKIIEECITEELFDNPQHPYTQGLLASIPNPEDKSVPLRPIPGNVPSLARRPIGCRFASRCAHAMRICHDQDPPLVNTTDGHQVSCWLIGQGGQS